MIRHDIVQTRTSCPETAADTATLNSVVTFEPGVCDSQKFARGSPRCEGGSFGRCR